jgi:DNA polymerase-3 subunit delta'
VDEVRGLKGFFAMAAGGARRVVIVDCADEMNPSAANALLKELEEPPKNTVMFLVSHQPSGLLPTIRSRCRTLRFDPLSPTDLAAALDQAGLALPGDASAEAIASLAEGSVGAAVQLVEQDGVALYRDLVQLASTLPGMDRSTALKLSDAAGARGAETRFDLTLALLDRLLARLARTGATGQTPAAHRVRRGRRPIPLVPRPAHRARLGGACRRPHGRARRGRAVNLDPAALIFDMFLDLDRTAERLAVPAA